MSIHGVQDAGKANKSHGNHESEAESTLKKQVKTIKPIWMRDITIRDNLNITDFIVVFHIVFVSFLRLAQRNQRKNQ